MAQPRRIGEVPGEPDEPEGTEDTGDGGGIY